MRALILILAFVLQLAFPIVASAFPGGHSKASGFTGTPCTAATATFAVACDASLLMLRFP